MKFKSRYVHEKKDGKLFVNLSLTFDPDKEADLLELFDLGGDISTWAARAAHKKMEKEGRERRLRWEDED